MNKNNDTEKVSKRTKRFLPIAVIAILTAVSCVLVLLLHRQPAAGAAAEMAGPAETRTLPEDTAAAAGSAVKEEPPAPTPAELPVVEVDEIENCLKQLDALTDSGRIEGVGGFQPSYEHLKKLRELTEEIETEGYSIGFVMIDIHTGQGLAYNPKEEFYSASSVKAAYMVSLVANEPDALDEYRRFFDNIAENSDNESYRQLNIHYGHDYYNEWCDACGADAYLFPASDYTYYSAEAYARMWLWNYRFFESGAEKADEVARLFETPYYHAIELALGEIYNTRTKSGWINMNPVAADDGGIVYAGDHPYVIAIMSNYGGDLERLMAWVYELEKAHGEITGYSRLTKSMEKDLTDYMS